MRRPAQGTVPPILPSTWRNSYEGFYPRVRRFCHERAINGFEDLERWASIPTPNQKSVVKRQTERATRVLTFRESFAGKVCKDKFGEATTHWGKLDLRIRGGVGNPCPLVFIGLPENMITVHEGKTALAEIEAAEVEHDTDAENGTAD